MGWLMGRARSKTASKCTLGNGGTTKGMETARKSTRLSVTGTRGSSLTTNTKVKVCSRTKSIPTMVVSTMGCSMEKGSSGTNQGKHSQVSFELEKRWQADSRCPMAAHTRDSLRVMCHTGGDNSGGQTGFFMWESGGEGRRRVRAWRCVRGRRCVDFGRAATGCAGSDCTLLYMLFYFLNSRSSL